MEIPTELIKALRASGESILWGYYFKEEDWMFISKTSVKPPDWVKTSYWDGERWKEIKGA